MTCIKNLIEWSVDRLRSFTALEFMLFKFTMLAIGMFFAACIPGFTRRNKPLLGVVAAILTGTLAGCFWFGDRYFELDKPE